MKKMSGYPYAKMLVILLLACNPMLSQVDNNTCGNGNSSIVDPPGVFNGSIDRAVLDDFEPVVFNIFFWGVNRPGSNNTNTDFPNKERDVLTAVANLNILYNEYNVFFKYYGYEEFESPSSWDHDNDPITPNATDPNGFYEIEDPYDDEFGFEGLKIWSEANGYKKTDAFNVYAYGWGIGFGGIAEFGHTTSGVSSGNLIRSSFPHEIGHNLSLFHTWDVTTYRDDNGNYITEPENVTRDSNNSNYNANLAGDKVVDTAANPKFYKEDSCSTQAGCYPFIDNCLYIGNEQDPVGDDYEPNTSDVINLMSDAYECTEIIISTGQGIRIQQAIENTDNYDHALTTIPALYEPYSAMYRTTETYDSVELVPLFQPGFDYQFVSCDGNGAYTLPSDYTDISWSFNLSNILLAKNKDETNYGSITHPNHSAIRIIQLDEDPIQPRKCYDNDFVPAPGSGKVTRFNDNVFNGNITITPQDSTAINNPNLIQQLPNGLYAIDKTYIDGVIEQTIIQKGNN